MELIIAAVAVAVLGVAAFAATGRLGSLPEPVDDLYEPTLPQGDVTPADLRRTRFGVTLRGYDMRQVDELLERLAGQLEAVSAERDLQYRTATQGPEDPAAAPVRPGGGTEETEPAVPAGGDEG